MALKKLKPTTPGQRFKVISAFEEITASKPEKSLVYGKKRSGGRNNQGKMTMRYIGGGHKKLYRFMGRMKYLPANDLIIEEEPAPADDTSSTQQ